MITNNQRRAIENAMRHGSAVSQHLAAVERHRLGLEAALADLKRLLKTPPSEEKIRTTD